MFFGGKGDAVGVENQSALPVQAFKQWLPVVLYRGVSKLDCFSMLNLIAF